MNQALTITITMTMHRVIKRMPVLLLCAAGLAQAHDAWLQPQGGGWAVKFGENWNAEPYPPAKVTALLALAADGRALPVTRRVQADEVLATVDGDPALLALRYDNGIYSRVGSGKSVNVPMDELPGATAGVSAPKWHKTIRSWAPVVLQPLGHALEMLPLQASAPVVGQPSRWQLLLDGKPLPNVRWGTGELSLVGQTDAAGQFEFVPAKAGRQMLWVGHRIDVKDDRRYTQLFHAATVIFDSR